MGDKPLSEFEKAGAGAEASFLREFWAFLRVNRKWWLLPVVLVLLLAGLLFLAAGTGAAPFLYTLF